MQAAAEELGIRRIRIPLPVITLVVATVIIGRSGYSSTI